MRVLWICNIVLNDFSQEFNIKKKPFGGWIEGLYYQLKALPDITIGFCFPIYDKVRMKNSMYDGSKYYSFHGKMDREDYNESMAKEFKEILSDFNPDIIHIWGTEYNHARAMMEACLEMGMSERVLVHIQGLVSFLAIHYALGIPEKFSSIRCGKHSSVVDGMNDFITQGESEKEVLRLAKYISGRTEWDRICVHQINRGAKYFHCDEVLRQLFYDSARWSTTKCQKYRIFISQASYPIKGFHFFLEALSIILESFPETEVYVGGNNPLQADENGDISGYGQYLQSLMYRYSLEGHVHFMGMLSDKEIIEQYKLANVFVSPSTIENSSNSICEAMILGVPVVASYVGGTPSLINHGKTGYVYPCDAYYMLAEYVKKIFANNSSVTEMSTQEILTGVERNNPSKITSIIRNIYDEVGGRKNSYTCFS